MRHHPLVRVTHWVNVVALAIMVGSGLRIFDAHPGFARIGERFCCYPFEGRAIPGWLTFGGWLAGARNWHFAMMWLLAVNGVVYLAFIWLHGEWRDLVPRRRDPRNVWEMVKFYLLVRRDHPRQGKHNALQKLVYFSMPLLGILAVLTGLAIWKPVQLAPLTAFFGGFVWARYWHFVVMLALVALSLGHMFMVLSVDPYSLRAMTTGGYDPSLSPEERNARPFQHLGRPHPAQRAPSTPAGRAPVGGTNGPGPAPERTAAAREAAPARMAPVSAPGAHADGRPPAHARMPEDARAPATARSPGSAQPPEDSHPPAAALSPAVARPPEDVRSSGVVRPPEDPQPPADARPPGAAQPPARGQESAIASQPDGAHAPDRAGSPAGPVSAGSTDASAADVAGKPGRKES